MAGGGVSPCVSRLTLEALPMTRPKKAGGWLRTHGTGPDKQDTPNGRMQDTEVEIDHYWFDNSLLILHRLRSIPSTSQYTTALS